MKLIMKKRENAYLLSLNYSYSNGSGSPAPSFANSSLASNSSSAPDPSQAHNMHASMSSPAARRRGERESLQQYRSAGQGGAPEDGGGSDFSQQQRQILAGYQQRRSGGPSSADGRSGDGGGAGADAGGGNGRGTPRGPGRGIGGKQAGGDVKDAPKAGVGLFFVQNDGEACEVDEIIQGSSAHSDGRIAVGDVLVAVDGYSVVGKDLGQARDMIVGQPDTSVSLTFLRESGGDAPSDPTSPKGASRDASFEYTVSLVRSLKRTPGTDAPPAMMPSYLQGQAPPSQHAAPGARASSDEAAHGKPPRPRDGGGVGVGDGGGDGCGSYFGGFHADRVGCDESCGVGLVQWIDVGLSRLSHTLSRALSLSRSLSLAVCVVCP